MVRQEVISKRLRKLDEYLTILHKLKRYSYDEFSSDPEFTSAVVLTTTVASVVTLSVLLTLLL